jgi:hypothetical protein
MVMIIFGDDDDGGHEDKVDGAGCDMTTETYDDDNIDDTFENEMVFTSASGLVAKPNPRDCCILTAENLYTSRALAWWTSRIL